MAEANILKRNMTCSLADKPVADATAYGLRSVNKAGYRLVDAVRRRTNPSTGSGGSPDIVGERAVGQGFGEMQPADFLRAVEIGERAGDAQHAVIAARRQPHGLGGVAQEFLALRVRLREGLQRRGRRFGIGADMRKSG